MSSAPALLSCQDPPGIPEAPLEAEQAACGSEPKLPPPPQQFTLPKHITNTRFCDVPQVAAGDELLLIDLRCVSQASRAAPLGPGVTSATRWKRGNYS